MVELRTIVAPLSVNFEVTPACNLRCSFCYVSSECTLQHPPLEQVIAILDELANAEVFEIGVFGGEFFFYPQWEETMRYAFKKGFFLSFVSNGTLITEKVIAVMQECNVHQGGISIHGPATVHDFLADVEGTYAKTTKGLGLCLDAGLHMSVLTTVTRDNFELLYATVSALNEAGLVRANMSYVVGRLCPAGRGEGEWQKDKLSLDEYIGVLEQIAKIREDFGIVAVLGDAFPLCKVPKQYHDLIQGCWMATGFGHIGHEGAVKGCGISQHSFGNLLKTPLKEIWQSTEMQEFRRLQWLPESCRSCSIFCGGGCIASGINPAGYGPDEFLEEENPL